jgi:hypothetical protein
MKASALRSALVAEELPSTTSLTDYRQHLMHQALVEPVEKEVAAMRVGMMAALGAGGAAVLRKYCVSCDDLTDMVSGWECGSVGVWECGSVGDQELVVPWSGAVEWYGLVPAVDRSLGIERGTTTASQCLLVQCRSRFPSLPV